MWHEERLFINGELRDADGGATFDNINPATEEVIGVSADASQQDLMMPSQLQGPRSIWVIGQLMFRCVCDV